jgi:hypothetical protein
MVLDGIPRHAERTKRADSFRGGALVSAVFAVRKNR